MATQKYYNNYEFLGFFSSQMFRNMLKQEVAIKSLHHDTLLPICKKYLSKIITFLKTCSISIVEDSEDVFYYASVIYDQILLQFYHVLFWRCTNRFFVMANISGDAIVEHDLKCGVFWYIVFTEMFSIINQDTL